jgi:hypothetical protein
VTAPALEQRRWLVTLGVPFALAACAVGGAFAVSPWCFVGALMLVPVWIAALALLALSSDTNGESTAVVHELPTHSAPTADAEQRAA